MLDGLYSTKKKEALKTNCTVPAEQQKDKEKKLVGKHRGVCDPILKRQLLQVEN